MQGVSVAFDAMASRGLLVRLTHCSYTRFGTNELLLTCTLIRYQKHMKEVKEAYQELKGKSLEEEIKSETGGDYERLLLEIVAAGE